MTQQNQKMSSSSQQQKYQPDVRAGKDDENRFSKQSSSNKDNAWKDTENKSPGTKDY